MNKFVIGQENDYAYRPGYVHYCETDEDGTLLLRPLGSKIQFLLLSSFDVIVDSRHVFIQYTTTSNCEKFLELNKMTHKHGVDLCAMNLVVDRQTGSVGTYFCPKHQSKCLNGSQQVVGDESTGYYLQPIPGDDYHPEIGVNLFKYYGDFQRIWAHPTLRDL